MTFDSLDSGAIDDNIVATLHVEVVVAAMCDADIVPLVWGLTELSGDAVVALPKVFATTKVLHPIVTGTTTNVTEVNAVEDEIVALPRENLTELTRVDDEIGSSVAEDYVFFVSAENRVVAGASLDHVRSGKVSDDVISRPTLDRIGSVAPLDAVIPGTSPKRVVADSADDRIKTVSSTDHDVIATGVLSETRRVCDVDGRRSLRRIADNNIHEEVFVDRVLVGLLILINFEEDRHRKEIDRQRACAFLTEVRVAHDERRKGVRLQFAEEIDVGGTAHVIEAVAVLETLDLLLEDVVVGRTEVPTERHTLFGEAAVPKVDVVETGNRHPIFSVRPLTGAV